MNLLVINYLKLASPRNRCQYNLSIYYNPLYPIASQFSCFVRTLKSLKLYKQITIYLRILGWRQFVTLHLQIPSHWKRTRILVIFQICQSCPTWTAYLYANQCPTHIVLTSETLPTDFQEKQIDSCKWNHNSESNFNWQNTSWEWNIHLSRFFIWKVSEVLRGKFYIREGWFWRISFCCEFSHIEKLFHNEKCSLKDLF